MPKYKNIKCRKLRPAKNKAERLFCNSMLEKGWKILRRGWPDYFLFKKKGNKLCVVEIKKSEGVHLKAEQFIVLDALSNIGIKCYVWRPKSKLTKFSVERKKSVYKLRPWFRERG